jgi:hypothetical protein
MWIFEPHVAEQFFEQMVNENNLQVHLNKWLERQTGGVVKKGNRIVGFKTTDGTYYTAKVFIHATYEGDLMAAAGLQYVVGREANAQYGEKWNGVQTNILQHDHYFKHKIDPYKVSGNRASGLLAEVSPYPPGEYGSAHKRVQAYCFSVCMSTNPDNRIPFPQPDNYDPARYEILKNCLQPASGMCLPNLTPYPIKRRIQTTTGHSAATISAATTVIPKQAMSAGGK